jgi:hypothetical protein
MKKHERKAKKRSKAHALYLKRLQERRVFIRMAQCITDRFGRLAKNVVIGSIFKDLLDKHGCIPPSSYGRGYDKPIEFKESYDTNRNPRTSN